MPCVVPSCMMVEATMSPRLRQLCLERITTAAPSDGRNPSASAEKEAHLPLSESKPAFSRASSSPGQVNVVTAPTMAYSHSPAKIA